MKPKVTYVMATRRVEFIDEAVESVYRQTLTDWEMIIVDGLKRGLPYGDKRIKIINEDLPSQMMFNRGRQEAQSDVILHLSDDDIDMPNRAERCYRGVMDGADIFVGSYLKIAKNGKPLGVQLIKPFCYETYKEGFTDMPLMSAGYKHSTCPYFRKDIALVADLGFFIDAHKAGLKVETSSDVLCMVRNWEGTLSTGPRDRFKEMMWEVERNRIKVIYGFE